MASWLVRLWLVGSGLLALFVLASGWKTLPAPHGVSAMLVPYLVFPWFLVVMVLGVDPVSGARLDALADGILSRPVTRLEYLLASWAARLVVVLGVFLLVVGPLAGWLCAVKRTAAAADHVTLFGLFAGLAVVSLVLTLQVTLGYLLGTVLRRPLLAIVVLLFVWYPSDIILHQLSLEQFSTISLSQAMPELLHSHWRETLGRPDPGAPISALASEANRFLRGFGADAAAAQRKQNFFDRGHYEDFSLPRVVLGYGLPTILALALTAVSFCRRDL